MEARVKATGDIVDVTYCHTSGDGVKYYEIDKSGYMMMEDELDFDFSYSPDYWERLKHQYAGMAMQRILANIDLLMSLAKKKADDYPAKYTVAEFAKDCAHALVEKMKEADR